MVTGYIDPNFLNPHGKDDAPIIIYGYTPSITLGLLGICCFSILLILLTVQMLRRRLWSYSLIVVGCLLEIIGYSFRYMSGHVDPYRIRFFVIQYFCITTAPVFIAAAIYTYLLGIMTFAFAIFLTLLASLAVTLGQSPECKSKSTRKDTIFRSTRVLCVASILVMVRTVFRLIECAQGVFGYLSSHEAFFGVLEFASIVVAVTLLAVWTPPVASLPKRRGEGYLMSCKDSENSA